jgi:hypothetical protein
MSWDLFENAPALRDANAIVFWIGLGVAEQLFFAWAVQWLRHLGSRAELAPNVVAADGPAHRKLTGDFY